MWFMWLRAKRNPKVAVKLGHSRSRWGNHLGAIDAFRIAAESGDPEHAPHGAYWLGRTHDILQNHHEAKKALQMAIDSGHPDVAPRAELRLGIILHEQDQELEAAATHFDLAIKSKHPEIAPRAAVELGWLRHRQGDDEAAKAAFQMASRWGHFSSAVLAQKALSELGLNAPAPAESSERKDYRFKITFHDSAQGDRVSADPDLVIALLVKHGRTDLVGQTYYAGPSPDGGYEITFR